MLLFTDISPQDNYRYSAKLLICYPRWDAPLLLLSRRVLSCGAHPSGFHCPQRKSRIVLTKHHIWSCAPLLCNNVCAVPRVRPVHRRVGV